MHRILGLSCLFATMLLGCQAFTPENPYEVHAKETIAIFNELADILENSKNIAEVEPKLAEVAPKIRKLRMESSTLSDPDEESRKKIKGDLMQQTEEAMTRYRNALQAFQKRDQAGAESLPDLFEKLDRQNENEG